MSQFSLCCCADLFEQKVNLEIPFATRPMLPELSQKIREFFDYEMTVVKPPGVQPRGFQINRMQVYNDDLKRWDNLDRPEQLAPGAQLYIFQPNIVDTQADLPQPRQPKHPAAGGAPGMMSQGAMPPQQQFSAPQQHPSAARSQGRRPLGERPHVDQDEKIRIVFGELDSNSKMFLDYGDLERGFKQRGLHFAVNTIGELFHKADLNRDGRIMYDEWVTWAQVYPNTLDAMYYRGRDTGEEAQIRTLIKELQDMNEADRLSAELISDMMKRSQTPGQLGNVVKSLHRYLGPAAQALHAEPARDVRPDMQRALEDLSREAANRERQMPELDSQLRAAQERRHVLEQQEFNLLEQEIRLERQRDAMRAQEAKYAEAENLFNNKANETGSPRRARRVISPSMN